MASTRRPRAESQAETRERLLDAAESLFETGGFHRTSVSQIAGAAGYTTGAIYSNFPRKEDLALAVIERGEYADWEQLDVELARSDDFGDQLIEIVRWYRWLQATGEPIGILRVELWLHSLQDLELRTALVAGQRRQQRHVAGLIDRLACGTGSVVTVDTGILAAALLGSADGTGIANSLDPSPHQAAAFAWTLATLLLAAFDPPPIDAAQQAELYDRLLAASRELGQETRPRRPASSPTGRAATRPAPS